MNPEPPLLVVAPLANDIDLARLPWPETANEIISVNSAKFNEMDLAEVIVDGMPFLLSRLTTVETRQRFTAQKFDELFTGLPTAGEFSIGVALRDAVASAKRLPEINRRMLLLGKRVGHILGATAAAWTPSARITSFAYFNQIVDEYLDNGPFPALFQTSFSEVRAGYFVTSGLRYFAGQEIRLAVPPDYSPSDAAKRLVRIIDDIATHGRIDVPAQAEGLVKGETLFFSPSDDLTHLDITIKNSAVNIDQANI